MDEKKPKKPILQVLYEDNHLLAVFKPAGLLVQGDNTGDLTLLEMAREYIKTKYNKPGRVYIGLIQRLDRPVAGVVLFARTSKAANRLCEQIREHMIKKTYWAVIHGKPFPSEGEISGHIRRHGRKSFLSRPDMKNAQIAILSYRTLESFSKLSLMEIELKTGRHHQIRVQMAGMGHPVLGDRKYGSPCCLPDRRIALLAKRLIITHPTKEEKVLIESPNPDNWPWPPPFK
ncbi:MAG: RluA family pseudouridine synthase [bacterium]